MYRALSQTWVPPWGYSEKMPTQPVLETESYWRRHRVLGGGSLVNEFWGWDSGEMLGRKWETRINRKLWMFLCLSLPMFCDFTEIRTAPSIGMTRRGTGLRSKVCFGNIYVILPAYVVFEWLWMCLVHTGDYPEIDLISCLVIKLCFISSVQGEGFT